MAAADVLSQEMALKAHIEAANRDYICEPRVGACCKPSFATDACPSSPRLPPPARAAEYRTVGGVAGPRVVVTTQYGDSDSDMLQQDASLKYLPVRIGKGCWIGSGSVIMPGAVLGDRCIVAPNSVVYGNWPAGVRLSGSPARAERAARA